MVPAELKLKVPVELKLMVPVEVKLKVQTELKFGGELLGDGYPKAKCKEVSRTKTQLKLQQN